MAYINFTRIAMDIETDARKANRIHLLMQQGLSYGQAANKLKEEEAYKKEVEYDKAIDEENK
jgi:uncharacterized protein YoaH (UPF0181 family)